MKKGGGGLNRGGDVKRAFDNIFSYNCSDCLSQPYLLGRRYHMIIGKNDQVM